MMAGRDEKTISVELLTVGGTPPQVGQAEIFT
jgi:hypothetical protein